MEGKNNLKSVLWMFGAISCLSIVAVSARELSEGMHTFQMLFVRSVIGLGFISILIFKSKKTEQFSTKNLKIHLLRNIFHFGGQYGWFVGLGILPLAQVFALEFTTPLWTILIAAIFLSEKLTFAKVFAVLLGIAGVFIILRPDIHAFSKESIIVLGAALCFAITFASTKQLSNNNTPLTVLFYMCLIQLPLGFVLSFNYLIIPDALQWFWLVVMSFAAMGAHFSITSALKIADASVVITLDFFRLPLIALVGVIFYNEGFDINIIIGGVIMVAGNLLVNKQSKTEVAE